MQNSQKNAYLCVSHFLNTRNMKALNYLVAFLGGVAIGAATGILFAPEKGTDTREKIAEALRKRGIRLNRKEMDTLIDDIANEIKSGDED